MAKKLLHLLLDETDELASLCIIDPETGATVAQGQAAHFGELRFNDCRDALRGYLAAQRGTAVPEKTKREQILDALKNDPIPQGVPVPVIPKPGQRRGPRK